MVLCSITRVPSGMGAQACAAALLRGCAAQALRKMSAQLRCAAQAFLKMPAQLRCAAQAFLKTSAQLRCAAQGLRRVRRSAEFSCAAPARAAAQRS